MPPGWVPPATEDLPVLALRPGLLRRLWSALAPLVDGNDPVVVLGWTSGCLFLLLAGSVLADCREAAHIRAEAQAEANPSQEK